jgi:hypothetical protein
MNASQLLEVATKVFVNQDQEAQKEAEGKMKKDRSGSGIEHMGRAQFQFG